MDFDGSDLETIWNKDSKYIHYINNTYLYTDTSEDESSCEEPTSLDITIKEMRIKELKYRHLCLHDSMLTIINMFDSKLSELNVLRKDVKYRTTLLNLFAIQLEEEMIVLNKFDLIKDEYLYNIFLKTKELNNKSEEVNDSKEGSKINFLSNKNSHTSFNYIY